MMLVTYRTLATGVLLAILERCMLVARGDEGSVGPTALYSVHLGFEPREMPQFAGLGKRYDGPIDRVVSVPRPPDPKFAARA